MKWIAIALCALCVVAGIGITCKPAPRSERFAAQIKALEDADPAADVDRAIAAGDLRFVGVMGFGPIVPGAPDWAKFDRRQHVRFIPNTSDAIESDQHRKLQRIAYQYAERYNQILLRKMPGLATTQSAKPAEEPKISK